MKKLIIIGGYGNGTVAASTVEDINSQKKEWEIIGFLNDFEKEVNGYPVLGGIKKDVADQYVNDPDVYFFYSLVTVKFGHKHLNRLLDLQIPTEKFATLIHPTAVISKFAKIGFGVSIQPLVVVGPNVTIHNHVQIFAQSLIGHGAVLHDYAYVANNSCIGANVILEEGAYLGTNSTSIENITFGKWSLTGIGAVVLKDVNDYDKVVGNPAKVIGSRK